MNQLYRLSAYVAASAAALILWSVPAQGFIIISGPDSHIPSVTIPPDKDFVELNPDPFGYIQSATDAIKSHLADEFADFEFFYHTGGLAGELHILRYEATAIGPHFGGGLLEARYTPAAGVDGERSLQDLRFIQLVATDAPLNGTSPFYIDPRPNDDTLPFYYTIAEDLKTDFGDKGSGTYRFADLSRRICRAHPDLIHWRGELMLAAFVDLPGNKTVDVYDGVSWGWDLHCLPEPGSLLLFLVGGAALMARRLLRRGR